MTNQTTFNEVPPAPALAVLLERAGAITAHVTDDEMEDDYLHTIQDDLDEALTCGNDLRVAAENSDESGVGTLMLDIAEALLEPGERLSGCALTNARAAIEEARKDHRAGLADRLGIYIDIAPGTKVSEGEGLFMHIGLRGITFAVDRLWCGAPMAKGAFCLWSSDVPLGQDKEVDHDAIWQFADRIRVEAALFVVEPDDDVAQVAIEDAGAGLPKGWWIKG